MLHSLLIRLDRGRKGAILLALDLCLFAAAFLGVRAFGVWPSLTAPDAAALLGAMLVVAGLLIRAAGLHLIQLNHYQSRAILTTFGIALVAAAAGHALSRLLAPALPVTFFTHVFTVFVLLSIGARMAVREIVVRSYRRRHGALRLLIYGAGQTGQHLAASLQGNPAYFALGFVDDDRALHGASIVGLRVWPSRNLEARVAKLGVDRIVLAMPSLSDVEKAAIAQRLSGLGCEVHAMPSFPSLLGTRERPDRTQPLDFAELLGRSSLESDLPGPRDGYAGKSVLVTGAGGSIGSELCLQIAANGARRLVLLDHSEIALYQIERKLARQYPGVALVAMLGSVCEPGFVRRVFAGGEIDVVVHAAAYKHLPVLERNIVEGMRNNVLGTKIVAGAAVAHGVESFILVSTDKAVRPTSWLGYSKRFAEMIVQDLATRSETTRLSIVRFGNVLGSSGSVISLFQEQIARGGPVTLTHEDVTRYFMTVSEAVRLVLLAGSLAKGGEVFVLDMGDPVPIRDLARALVEASGYSVRDADHPHGDIEIRTTGLRAGEKMAEELLIGADLGRTLHPKILTANEVHPSQLEMATALSEISQAVEDYDESRLAALLPRFAAYLGAEGPAALLPDLRRREPS